MDSANIMVLFCLFNENGIFLNKEKKILRFNSYICRNNVLRDELEVPKDIVVRGLSLTRKWVHWKKSNINKE